MAISARILGMLQDNGTPEDLIYPERDMNGLLSVVLEVAIFESVQASILSEQGILDGLDDIAPVDPPFFFPGRDDAENIIRTSRRSASPRTRRDSRPI